MQSIEAGIHESQLSVTRRGVLGRANVWLAVLALIVLAPALAHAQTLTADFGLVRGTTSKQVCFINAGWGTFYQTSSSSSSAAFSLQAATSPFVQGSPVCATVQFNAGAGVSGDNSGTIYINYLQAEYLVPITITINASARYSVPTTGFVSPKFQIMGVTYAPPGHASSVSYGSSSKVASTTTIQSSFSAGTSFSSKLSLDISKYVDGEGAGAKVGGSASSDFSVTSTASNSATVAKSTELVYKTNGPGCAGCDNNDSVDHNYDVIWIWLNPLHVFTIYSLEPKVVEWNGYGWNSRDPVAGMDVYPVLVGYLNGTFPMNPDRGVGAKLARAWAAAGVVWQSGEGPALSCADRGAIARADVFADYTDAACVKHVSAYVMNSPFPSAGATTSDKRFTRLTALPTVPYYYGAPATNLNIQNVNTTTVASGLTTTYKQAHSYEAGFTAKAWLLTLESNSTKTYTTELTYSVNRALENTSTSNSSLQITPPTDQLYPGYSQFAVFQDNEFGTFMFYPVPGS